MSKYRSGLLLFLFLLLVPLSTSWSQGIPTVSESPAFLLSSVESSTPSLEDQIRELNRQIVQKNLLLARWLNWYERLKPEEKAFLLQVQELQTEVQSWKDSYQKERNSRDSLEKASLAQIAIRDKVAKEKSKEFDDLQFRFNIVCGIGIGATVLLVMDLALRR